MAKAKKEDAPQRLPGAEGECISREQQEILEWLRKVKFRKNLLGGVDPAHLAQLYFHSEVPTRRCCLRYFRISQC